MKIAICLNHFLPQSIGGTEVYTFQLAKQLEKSGYEVIIIIPFFDSLITNNYFYEGIRVIRFAEPSLLNRRLLAGKMKPLGLEIFSNILMNEKPDLIHFHELTYGRGISFFHVTKAHEFKIPIVTTYHLASYSCFKGSLIYKDGSKCDGIINISKCTHCVFESKKINKVKAKLLAYTALGFYNFNINAASLNNPIATALGFPFIIQKLKSDLLKIAEISSKTVVLTKWYRNVLENNGIPNDKLVYIKQGLPGNIYFNKTINDCVYPLRVVFVGRISAVKGLHTLIEAICKIQMAKISLYIYGPQIEMDYVNECKKKTFSIKNIFWMGPIPPEDVIKTLNNYHLLCLPSAFEMSPLIIQEAFAAGLPVLASEVNGNTEQIIDGENGWLFRVNDAKHLIDKLELLLNDLTLIEKAKQQLPESDTFKDIANRHLIMYNEIFKNKMVKS